MPLRLPTAHTSLLLLHRIRHTTPPLPPLSKATRFRRNSPDRRSQILTVPSSDDVTTKRRLNCRHVTALWCLLAPTQANSTFISIHWTQWFIRPVNSHDPTVTNEWAPSRTPTVDITAMMSLGHGTSVTWHHQWHHQIDSARHFSYRLPIVTNLLFPIVSEIFSLKDGRTHDVWHRPNATQVHIPGLRLG